MLSLAASLDTDCSIAHFTSCLDKILRSFGDNLSIKHTPISKQEGKSLLVLNNTTNAYSKRETIAIANGPATSD